MAIAESLLHGALVTIEIVALALLVAGPCALAAALARISPFRALRILAVIYIEFVRGTSALVQLFAAYFVLPEFGIVLPSFFIGFMVLGINAGAYGAEIIRGAIGSVPPAQHEAAFVLGLGYWTRMFRVLLPQALPTMLPPLGNTMIDVLKASALVSLITVSDFTRMINTWATTGALNLTVAYSLMLVGYLILSAPINGGMRVVEHRLRKRLPLAKTR